MESFSEDCIGTAFKYDGFSQVDTIPQTSPTPERILVQHVRSL